MAERTMSGEIAPLSEEIAQQLADAIDEANNAQAELDAQLPMFTDRIFTMVENRLLEKVLMNSRRFADASFLTRWYWKWKLEKSRSAFEQTHKVFDEWRGVYANH